MVREHDFALETGTTRPRVVLVPGIMGSILRDDRVPANLFQDRVAPAIAYFLAAKMGVSPLVTLPLLKAIGRRDMSVIWGTIDMLPWVFLQDEWCRWLLRGNQLDSDGVHAVGVTTLTEPYKAFVEYAKRWADLLEFAYDWRLSNDENARRLGDEIKAKWFAGVPDNADIPEEARVSIVAHSMGGLVARCYIERNARPGYKYVRQLITAATPHDGAPEAFSNFHRQTAPLARLFSKEFNAATVSAWLVRDGAIITVHL